MKDAQNHIKDVAGDSGDLIIHLQLNKLHSSMKNNLKILVMIIGLSFLGGASYGKFQGVGANNRTHTVKEIRDNALRLKMAETQVRVKGNIVEQINYDTYQFRDATGTIRVEIEPHVLPQRPFDENTELILVGEVENFRMFGEQIWVTRVIFPN